MESKEGRVKITRNMIYVAYPDGDADAVDLERNRILSLNGYWGGGCSLMVRNPEGETRRLGLPVRSVAGLIRDLGLDLRRTFPSSHVWINYGEIDIGRTMACRTFPPDIAVVRYKGVRGDGTGSASDSWRMVDAVKNIGGFRDLFMNGRPPVRDRIALMWPWRTGAMEIGVNEISRFTSLDFGRTVHSLIRTVKDDDGGIRDVYYYVYDLGADDLLGLIRESGLTALEKWRGRKLTCEVKR